VLDRQGVLIPDINHSFARSGPIGTNDHTLQNTVRISLQKAPVHVGAWVSLIGITDHIFRERIVCLRLTR
jgi:hypothetical protein